MRRLVNYAPRNDALDCGSPLDARSAHEQPDLRAVEADVDQHTSDRRAVDAFELGELGDLLHLFGGKADGDYLLASVRGRLRFRRRFEACFIVYER